MQINGSRLWRNWVFVHLTSWASVSAMSSARCVFTGLISSTAHFFGRVSKKRFGTTETSSIPIRSKKRSEDYFTPTGPEAILRLLAWRK
jgi:hypothetical protein